MLSGGATNGLALSASMNRVSYRFDFGAITFACCFVDDAVDVGLTASLVFPATLLSSPGGGPTGQEKQTGVLVFSKGAACSNWGPRVYSPTAAVAAILCGTMSARD
jgi:hypothetical protein